MESFVGKGKLDRNDWVCKHKINYRFDRMSSIEEIEKKTPNEELGNFKYKDIFLYDIYGNINKIHSYTDVQSRETGESFPNWLQVEKSIYYDDKNRIDKFYYIFNEPHPEWRGTEPQDKWIYIYSYN